MCARSAKIEPRSMEKYAPLNPVKELINIMRSMSPSPMASLLSILEKVIRKIQNKNPEITAVKKTFKKGMSLRNSVDISPIPIQGIVRLSKITFSFKSMKEMVIRSAVKIINLIAIKILKLNLR